jgi:hypothetical protein
VDWKKGDFMTDRLRSKTFIFVLAGIAILVCGGLAFGQAVQTGSYAFPGGTAIRNALNGAGYVQTQSTALASQVKSAIADDGLPPGIAVRVVKQALRGGDDPSTVFANLLSYIEDGMSPGQAANLALDKGNQSDQGGPGSQPSPGSPGSQPSPGGGQTAPSPNASNANGPASGSNQGNSGNGNHGGQGHGHGKNG